MAQLELDATCVFSPPTAGLEAGRIVTPIGEVTVLGEIKARVTSGSEVDLPGSRSRELLASNRSSHDPFTRS